MVWQDIRVPNRLQAGNSSGKTLAGEIQGEKDDYGLLDYY